MNWDIIQGKWQQLKGDAQAQWGKLTDDDIQQADGSREALAGKIQERYGVARDEAEKQIDAWADKVKASV
ncbi:MAG: CsbD family protein [Pseudomonadota bacterium]